MRVFVSGPITQGDQFSNVRAAIDYAEDLLALGHAPFVPHFYAWWHMVHEHTWQEWIALDVEWLSVCDCIFRIPGPSLGADIEENLAKEIGKPIFYDLDALQSWATAEEACA